MKLICLNTWEGMLWPQLSKFIVREREAADIFCLQEVFHAPEVPAVYAGKKLNLYSELQKLLPDFRSAFAPTFAGATMERPDDLPTVEKGLATFVRSSINIAEQSTTFVYRSYNDRTVGDPSTNPRLVHSTTIDTPAGLTHICNFHGLWVPGGKIDNPARLGQAHNVRKLLDILGKRTLLCGDFNLLPDTESLHIMEGGMANLIKQYGITSTRSRYYERTKYSTYADYILLTPDIKVESFSVSADEVSDHLPLVLEFF